MDPVFMLSYSEYVVVEKISGWLTIEILIQKS